MAENVLEVKDLKKQYHTKNGTADAVKGISFHVQKGAIFGFLGANGAGKSTTINMVTTQLLPTSGQIIYDGKDMTSNVVGSFAGCQLRYDTYLKIEEMKEKYGQEYEQPTGVPMITSAYNLPSKYIIHVVGPIVYPYLMNKHKIQLAACYRASLDLAAQNGCKNIAFCCISTGVFLFPQDKAAEIAVKTVKEWLDEHPNNSLKQVIFNVFKDSDRKIYQNLLCK